VVVVPACTVVIVFQSSNRSEMLGLVAVLALAVAGATAGSNPDSPDVMYQSFNWDVLSMQRSDFYKMTQDELPNLAGAGISGIWFPPPSQAADTQGYMPGEWYNILDGASLLNATTVTNNLNMQVIMDIVINHRSAQAMDSCTNQYSVFYDPDWSRDRIVKHDSLCDGGYEVPDSCGPGNYDTGDNACYCPDVDHTNTLNQNDIVQWQTFLMNNYSVDSYRYDMVSGYAGEYVEHYNAETNPKFSVGEYFNGDTNTVCDWIQSTNFQSTAFDFPNRYVLDNCVKKNDYTNMMAGINPAGVLGRYPANAAPFLDNHDTARDDRFANGNWDEITMGYAYILTHPGTPFVFYDDWNIGQIQTAIKKIIPIRQDNQLTSTSEIYIAKHQYGLYAAYLGPGATYLGGGTVAVKLGTNSWSPSNSQFKLATSGDNYAIWVKG
jgi:alpha-amylase